MRLDRTGFAGVKRGVDRDFLVKRLDAKLNDDRHGLAGDYRDARRRRFEALELGRESTNAGRRIGESELAAFVRDLDPRFAAAARQRERHARHDERLAAGNRHGHGTGDAGCGGLRGDRGSAKCGRDEQAEESTIHRSHSHLQGTAGARPARWSS